VPGGRDWDAELAQGWLAWLARQASAGSTRDLAWWRLRNAFPRPVRVLSLAVVGGLTYGLAAARGVSMGLAVVVTTVPLMVLAAVFAQTLTTRPGARIAIMAVTGLAVGLSSGRTAVAPTPARTRLRVRGRTATLVNRLIIGAVVGLATFLPMVMLAFVVYPSSTAAFGVTAWLGFGLTFGLTVGLMLAVTDLQAPIDVTTVASSAECLANDRRNTLLQMLVPGSASGAAVGLALGLRAELYDDRWLAIRLGVACGLAAALAVGLAVALTTNAWGQWVILARFWLPLTGQLPWPVVAFLADAPGAPDLSRRRSSSVNNAPAVHRAIRIN
jgi:hypothetical protein